MEEDTTKYESDKKKQNNYLYSACIQSQLN